MDQRIDFSSPVYFQCKANKDGKCSFQDLSTTYDDEVVTVGNIYIKATSFNVLRDDIANERNVRITVSEVPTESGSRTYDSFLEFVEWRRQSPRKALELDGNNQLVASGVFPDQRCVPGFDFGCATKQHGFDRRSGRVSAAHFVVDVSLSGFWDGEVITGYLLLEILRKDEQCVGKSTKDPDLSPVENVLKL